MSAGLTKPGLYSSQFNIIYKMKAFGIYTAASIMLLSALAGGCNKGEDPRGQWEMPDSMAAKTKWPFLYDDSLPGVFISRDQKGIINYIHIADGADVMLPESAEEFFREILQIQEADRFKMEYVHSLTEGFTTESYIQYHNGLKVDGCYYYFKYLNRQMYLACGNYTQLDWLDTTPVISAEDAFRAFVLYKEIPVEQLISYDVELLIKATFTDATAPILVYKVSLILNNEYSGETGYVYADSGEVIPDKPVVIIEW
jgi:hypothetical protein